MTNFSELRSLLARAVMALSVIFLPLMAVGGLHAVEGANSVYKKQSAGAGFVLLVSLQRSR
mgnify:CR=1 FL=1